MYKPPKVINAPQNLARVFDTPNTSALKDNIAAILYAQILQDFTNDTLEANNMYSRTNDRYTKDVFESNAKCAAEMALDAADIFMKVRADKYKYKKQKKE